MPTPPKTYRVYSFDLTEKTVTADFITAASDEEAIANARACSASKCEIWDDRRLVARLDQGAEAATAIASAQCDQPLTAL